ncbi:unnamed protein product [Chondrus crispus]|uniref:Uncharacterized protein n=1 Tax=Chondrus crispus TaxID=2769 RepID=R7QA29_CHOCR|nr:unnamed protein product [Chondrus crispus]CDF34623.1 unnamed protein product [Chondrus crispus]|eukprot:XP_005714442.1 unnamed protein product [Chondrus crispus]
MEYEKYNWFLVSSYLQIIQVPLIAFPKTGDCFFATDLRDAMRILSYWA